MSLVFSIFVAEIAGRMLKLLPVRSSHSYIKLTQEVGRLPLPLSHSRFAEPGEFDVRLQFNAMGFRDPRIDFPEAATGTRILAVGDSFVTAWEVEFNDPARAAAGSWATPARAPSATRALASARARLPSRVGHE